MLLKYFVTVTGSACTPLAFKVDPQFTLKRRKPAELGGMISLCPLMLHCQPIKGEPHSELWRDIKNTLNRQQCGSVFKAFSAELSSIEMWLCCWCSVSEAGQAASFCHACYFLCDWLCERWRKREAMIRQRSHVTDRHSEHELYLFLLYHASAFSCWE